MSDTIPGFESESILRVEAIDKKRRDRSEREPDWRRYARGALHVLIGIVLLYLGASRFVDEGLGLPAIFGGVMGCFTIFVAILTFREKPSFFKNMDRYVFTDRRIALLDENDQIIDEIGADMLGDLTRDKRYEITIHWANDPTRDKLFPIIHVTDFNEIYEFIAAKYHIRSHDPEGWPRNEQAELDLGKQEART